MADVVDYKVFGDDIQVVEIELDPGEGVRAEAGAMLYMEDGIEMQTNMGGGVFGGFKRILTGESFFITTFLYSGSGKGHVAFGAPYPGKIIPLDVKAGDRVLFGKWSGTEVIIYGEERLILKESDILGVIEGKSGATAKAA